MDLSQDTRQRKLDHSPSTKIVNDRKPRLPIIESVKYVDADDEVNDVTGAPQQKKGGFKLVDQPVADQRQVKIKSKESEKTLSNSPSIQRLIEPTQGRIIHASPSKLQGGGKQVSN